MTKGSLFILNITYFIKGAENEISFVFAIQKNMFSIELMLACSDGDLEKVKRFDNIEFGAGSRRSVFTTTPLDMASEGGHIEVVKYLVSRGADVSGYDQWAVVWASAGGHLETVKYLVSEGADITFSDNEAINLASIHNRFEMVKYLISIGADPSHAIKNAVFYRFSDIINYIISIGVDITDGRDAAFGQGMATGDLNAVQYAVSLGSNVVDCGKWKHPAATAEYTGNVKIFRFLVGVVINEMKKYTVLMLLNKNRMICKDTTDLILKKMIRYKEKYHIYRQKSLIGI